MSAIPPPVAILTSGVGLGVYIPALLIEQQFMASGVKAHVEVLEEYYTAERRSAHLAHKTAYHADFALAQFSNRMVRDVQDCLDEVAIRALLQRWQEQQTNRFIAWSGFWLPIIERYRRLFGEQLHVDHCRIDADISASFRIHPKPGPGEREIWLWNGHAKRIIHEIPVSSQVPVPYAARCQRLVVHGGGWGIGSYQNVAGELGSTSYALDRVIHEVSECRNSRAEDRCFMPDPDWHPWTRSPEGNHGFPPIGEVLNSSEIRWMRRSDFHPFYDVVRRSKAIVSKPGGCTLIDSLSSATPVVLLEPYSSSEKSNGIVWEHLGFGISWESWRKTGFDVSVLERLHANIVSRTKNGVDYARAYAAELLQEIPA